MVGSVMACPRLEWPKMPPSVMFVDRVQTATGAPSWLAHDELVVRDRGGVLTADDVGVKTGGGDRGQFPKRVA
jgi:hypothetical protein